MLDDPQARPIVRLLPGRHKRLVGGHPWVYSNEIAMDAAAKALPSGSLVTLQDGKGEALGLAMFNPHPLISARVLDLRATRRLDEGFLAHRLERALGIRTALFEGSACYRLVHAEADGLPGLVIDRFGGTLVCQLNSAGMDRLEPLLLDALARVVAPETVVLRNDSSARGVEGLERGVRVARGAVEGPVTLIENGATFFADPLAGQKTGWFYDQRDNRAFMARLAKERRVLDLYAFGGGFGVLALVAGAHEAVLVDRAEPALAAARRAAEANGVAQRCRLQKGEVFQEMQRLAEAGERFGVVIADPPAFAKSRKDLPAALRGYRKMTRMAAALVEPGGYLFAASCSHNVSEADFAEAVRRGLLDAGRAARILRAAGAAPDHPVHPSLPESAYLKALALALD
jgi:23S rRNA (cytosine1962-C5)-methyltransferase